ncbi:Mur ligase domain-containing protein [Kitasatospora sp. RB6PN24]|uniref:Mur ligase domain-containing protein n=1 Tax=Kitasatospora humi TaxID=2893891 RepID=UPI001E496609|nr:Mur ligase domain-containing protein [Kitasatospora humi]MCC9309158.1 Mur ligase domain-containing protein [Kitasatospora humi]
MTSTSAKSAPSREPAPPVYVKVLLAGAEHDTAALLQAVSDEEPLHVQEYAGLISEPGFAPGEKRITALMGSITVGDTVMLLFALPAEPQTWARWSDLLHDAAAGLLVTGTRPPAGADLSALRIFEQYAVPHLIALTSHPDRATDEAPSPDGAGPGLTSLPVHPLEVGDRAALLALLIEAIDQHPTPVTPSSPQEAPRMQPRFDGSPQRLEAPHLVGIDTDGSGMPGLAELLLARGARVSGSTNALAETDSAGALRGLGAVINHEPGPNLMRADRTAVIWSGHATKAERAELERAQLMDIPVLTFAEAIGYLAARSRTVVVVGSHSTATATGMLTSALGYRNPSWVLRRPVAGRRLGHHSGGDLLLVDLAQETDLAHATTVSIITAATTQPHQRADELEELEGLARRSEAVVLPIWEAGTAELASRLAEHPGPRVVTVGQAATAQVRILDARWDGRTARLLLKGLDGVEYTLAVPVLGRHQAHIAALVFAAGQLLNAAPVDLAEGLGAFAGITRSLVVAGHRSGVTVLDSIAQHPTELAQDLAAARALTAHGGRVIAVLEPTSWLTSLACGAELGRQLAAADHAFLLPVHDPATGAHPGFYTGTPAIARSAAAHGLAGHLQVVDNTQAAISEQLDQQIAAQARPGDVIAVIGTGYTTHLAPRLLAALGNPARSTSRTTR